VRTTRLLLPGLLLIALAAPAAAAEGKNVFRARVVWANPSDGNATLLLKPIGNVASVETDSAWGAELGYERMLGEKLGLSFTLGRTSHSMSYRVLTPSSSGSLGDLTMTPFTGTVLYHFNPDSRTDVYLGAGLAYVIYDLDSDLDSGVSVGDDLALAVEFGVDFPLGPRGLYLSADIKYINSTADFEGESLGIDPFLLGVGIAFRF
jgi:outer membrane protein W